MSSASAGAAQKATEGNTQTVGAFFSSLVTGIVVFAAQIALFNALKLYLPNVYRPRTYLVPEKERTPLPPSGLWRWILPVFQTSGAEFRQKCGLDAYFFLRYLQVLLKIFLSLSIVILPILLPINATGGVNKQPGSRIRGLNVLSFGNVSDANYRRYWAHLVVAVLVVIYISYTLYGELRNFIKVRQEYLTSPQHRLRASARTILVTSITPRFMSVEALDALFDVYPGGIKHIWINRNYQKLSDKVDLRNTLAQKLESAETNLVLKAKQKHMEKIRKEEKAAGKKKSKKELQQEADAIDGAAEQTSPDAGISANNPHQAATLQDLLRDYSEEQAKNERTPANKGFKLPLGMIGDGLGEVYGRVGQGVGAVAHGVGRLGQLGGLRNRGRTANINTDGPTDQRPDSRASEQDVSKSASESTEDVAKGGKRHAKYPDAFNAEVADAEEVEAAWQKYLEPGDRDTTRLPLFGLTWMPFMPSWTFIGKKVDTIYYCRKELARLNLEIESDQQRPTKFPLMNSAFIQFNQQVAAHMACQCLSHHVPQQMTPRMIEISPDDVIWDNMSMKWWERDLRGYGITIVIIALIIFFVIPSTFVAGLSQLSSLAQLDGFGWVNNVNGLGKSILQGVAPAAVTAVLFALVPLVLKLLHNLAGAHTGNAVQRATQKSYFAFLFTNIFFFVTIVAGSGSILEDLTGELKNVSGVPNLLAQNLPTAANYFFNYMILQALSISAGALAQVGRLVGWFILRPLLDTTARQKWRRPISLPQISWGTFFPVYTNFACIGIIYSVIAPLVMVFNIVIFGLFWIAYRYNTLYVNKFRFDTGGLLFPTAIKQLFTGLYVLSVCLAALFFLKRPPPDHKGNPVVCLPQAIIMIIVIVGTAFYQWLLHRSFAPLFEFLPITLEDDAVIRDEEFAKAHAQDWGEGSEIEEAKEQAAIAGSEERNQSSKRTDLDRKSLKSSKSSTHNGEEEYELAEISPGGNDSSGDETLRGASYEHQSPRTDSSEAPLDSRVDKPILAFNPQTNKVIDTLIHPPDSSTARHRRDVEAQRNADGHLTTSADPNGDSNQFFGAFSDEIEDLGPKQRDALVEHAFKHKALRARRPVIWIPRDDLGVSDDEIHRTHQLTEWVWISNEGTAINSGGKVVFKRPPPDFSEMDLIDV